MVSGDLTRFVPGTYSGAPNGSFALLGDTIWNSDYLPEKGAEATSWTIVLTDNGDGTDTLAATAFYAS